MKWSIQEGGSRGRLLRNGTSLFRGHEMAIIESYRFNSGQFRKSESLQPNSLPVSTVERVSSDLAPGSFGTPSPRPP